MAEFNVSDVASRINPPQQMSIGDMLNIARGAQAYKQAEQVNPLLVQQQQAETELAQKTLQPKIEQQGYITKQAETSAKSSKFKLNNEQAQVLQDEATATIDDPNIKNAQNTIEGKQAALETLLASKKRALARGVDEHTAEAIYAPYINQVLNDPTTISQQLLNATRAGTGAQGVANLNNPTLETINGVTQLVTKGTGNVQPLNVKVPYQQPVTDVTGRTAIQQRGPSGEYIGTAPYPTTPAGQQGQPSEFFNIPPGETKESLGHVVAIRNTANEAAKAAPTMHNANRQVIDLAKNTKLGGGAETLRNLGGGYALLPWTSDESTNFDKLGHYIAQNSIQLAAQAGLGTDAGRALGEQASGSRTFTREALSSIARTNDALVSGVELFNRGLENNIKKTNNPFTARDFQNQWAQTVDVNALRLYTAVNHNDTDEIRQVVKEVGGKDGIKSQAYKNLLARINKMSQLIQGQ